MMSSKRAANGACAVTIDEHKNILSKEDVWALILPIVIAIIIFTTDSARLCRYTEVLRFAFDLYDR